MTQGAGEPTEFERVVNQGIADARDRRAAEKAGQDAARASSLASTAERDAAITALAEAYSQGRINAEELSVRTTNALSARTHGDLDGALAGLPRAQQASTKSPARFILAGVFTLVAAPFLLIGLGFALGADQLDELIFGLVFLVMSLPPLLIVWRWAWPTR